MHIMKVKSTMDQIRSVTHSKDKNEDVIERVAVKKKKKKV